MTQDAVVADSPVSWEDTKTLEITVGNNPDRYLIVGAITYHDGANPESVSSDLDGALTLVPNAEVLASSFPGDGVSIYELANPTVGTHTITVNWPTGNAALDGSRVIAVSEYDVASVRGGAAAADNSSAPSVNITTQSGDIVLDFYGIRSDAGDADPVDDESNPIFQGAAGGADEKAGASRKIATGTTTTASWSITDGDDAWALAAVALVPATGNQAPVIDSPIPNQTWVRGGAITPIDLTTVFSDPDGDPLTFTNTLTALPAGISINNTTDVIEGTPTGPVGTAAGVGIRASDGTNQAEDVFDATVRDPQVVLSDVFDKDTSALMERSNLAYEFYPQENPTGYAGSDRVTGTVSFTAGAATIDLDTNAAPPGTVGSLILYDTADVNDRRIYRVVTA